MKLIVFWLPLLGFLSGCSSPAAPAHLEGGKLENAIISLEPWGITTNYSDAAWKKVIDVAKLLQKTNPDGVAQALDHVMKAGSIEGNHQIIEERKIVLLLRVMFNTGLKTGQADWRTFRGWAGDNGRKNLDGTPNIGWPVAWSDGHPQLLSGYEGASGPPYLASDEYRHFLATYPMRTLD
jgi:hypothetical protein